MIEKLIFFNYYYQPINQNGWLHILRLSFAPTFFNFQIYYFTDNELLLESMSVRSTLCFLVAIYDCILLRAVLCNVNKLIVVDQVE